MSSEGGSEFKKSHDDVVHSWAIFRLLRRFVSSPHGEIFERTFVSTPGAVGCVAVTPDGDVVLVSQYRATFDSFVWEIPAGMRDIEGEPASVTAQRELTEETGFIAESIEYLGRCFSSPGVTDSVVEIYLATNIVAGAPEPHGPEEQFMRTALVPFREALQMVDDGRIVDAKTSYALLLTARKYPNLVH